MSFRLGKRGPKQLARRHEQVPTMGCVRRPPSFHQQDLCRIIACLLSASETAAKGVKSINENTIFFHFLKKILNCDTHQPGLFINSRLIPPFIDFIGNTLSPLIYKLRGPFSSLALDHVTAQACVAPACMARCSCLQPQINVTAGGGVINGGAEELYHPEEIQPTARD